MADTPSVHAHAGRTHPFPADSVLRASANGRAMPACLPDASWLHRLPHRAAEAECSPINKKHLDILIKFSYLIVQLYY